MEGKEKMPAEEKISKPEKIIFSEKDHEAMGYTLLKAEEAKLAKAQFSAAHWTEENIQKVLADAAPKNSEKETQKMSLEEKKEFLKKMLEEFEEKAEKEEKNGKKEKGKYYRELARAYRRELEKIPFVPKPGFGKNA
jgi:acyl-CoA reductase-like NAD-dependent aldehyde dehydrogenase